MQKLKMVVYSFIALFVVGLLFGFAEKGLNLITELITWLTKKEEN